MSTLLERTQDHVHEIFPEIVIGRPDHEDLPTGTVLGTYCYSWSHGMRWITKPDAQIAPGILPGDVARQWIRENYKLPIRRRRDQVRKYILPLRALRGKYGEGVYMDVEKAYRRILEMVGYDIDYRLGSYLSCRAILLPEEFYQFKGVYQQCLAFSASFTSTLPFVQAGKVVCRRIRNLFYQPCLYAFASEFLSSIAQTVITKCSCVYANTDGVIVKTQDEEAVERIGRTFGVNMRVVATGAVEIWGVGSYRIGDKRTARWDENPPMRYQSLLPNQHEVNWLRSRVQRLNNRSKNVV